MDTHLQPRSATSSESQTALPGSPARIGLPRRKERTAPTFRPPPSPDRSMGRDQHGPQNATMIGDDRLWPVARWVFLPLVPFTAVFGPLLVLAPGHTAKYWAWTIQPSMSAVW